MSDDDGAGEQSSVLAVAAAGALADFKDRRDTSAVKYVSAKDSLLTAKKELSGPDQVCTVD